MVFVNQTRLTRTKPKEPHLELGFAASPDSNTYAARSTFFPNECIIVAQGFGPYARVLADEIAETALLAHKILRQKSYYFESRERFISQQFKLTARKLMRLAIPTTQRQGSLAIVSIASRTWWFGGVGNLELIVINNRTLVPQVTTQPNAAVQTLLGQTKYIEPLLISGESMVGDWYFIAPHGLYKTVSSSQLIAFSTTNQTPEQLAQQLITHSSNVSVTIAHKSHLVDE